SDFIPPTASRRAPPSKMPRVATLFPSALLYHDFGVDNFYIFHQESIAVFIKRALQSCDYYE
ncbi:MAG: hypothetical protein J6Q71_01520, partial [Bacteroidales bacterium]|nr:hypothetical protein [Bacteroidales bacterium]